MTVVVLRELLDLLLTKEEKKQHVFGPTNEEAWLPTEASLRDELRTDVSRRKARLVWWHSEVRAHWDALAAIAVPGDNLAAGQLFARIQNIDRVTSSDLLPIDGLSNSAPKNYSYRLKLNTGVQDSDEDGSNQETLIAYGLMQLSAAAVPAALDGCAASLAKTIDALMSLRRLDDVLIRWLAASDAANATGTSLALILALYRIEGNFSIPPSYASLGDDIVSAVPKPKHIPSAVSKVNVQGTDIPAMRHLVILIDAQAKVDAAGIETYEGLRSHRIRSIALGRWLMHIIGFDVAMELVEDIKHDFFDEWVDAYVPWLAQAAVILSASQFKSADHKSALNNTLLQQHVEKLPDGLHPQVLRVTPEDPRNMIATILTGAALWFRRLTLEASLFDAGTLDPKASVQMAAAQSSLRDATAYLRYTLFHYPNEHQPAGDRFPGVLVNALGAAGSLKSPRYAQLARAIKPQAALVAKVTKMWNALTDDDARLKQISSSMPELIDWLKTADNLSLLQDFLETAPGATFGFRRAQRASAIFYARSKTYYDRLLHPPP